MLGVSVNVLIHGILARSGPAKSRKIHETMRDKAKSPQYAIRAERREILPTTPVHAAHAHDAQHDARHDAAHILRLTIPQREYSSLIALMQKIATHEEKFR
jgi:hypothetical protein